MSKSDLSRFLSHALRHAPDEYGLVLDYEGWARVEDVVTLMRKQKPEWQKVDEYIVRKVVETSLKQRHEIRGGCIRAKYGHSIPIRRELTPEIPPDFLYHGTSRLSLPSIMTDGLKPMSRQYVHLSTDIKAATSVGSRKASSTVVLKVASRVAHDAGQAFYLVDESVWLTGCIFPKLLKIAEEL